MSRMNRFDLELKLMESHNIVEDLKTLASYVIENPNAADTDFIANALQGLACLQEARHSATWDVFLRIFELDQYNNNNEDDNYEKEHENRTSTK